MSQWVAVHALQDNTPVKADTFNKPVFELAERTNYLYNWIRQLTGNSPFESLRLTGVALTTAGALAPAVKDFVCLDPLTGTYIKAQSSMSLLDEFASSESSFAIGILVEKNGATGTVVIAGKLPLATGSSAWQLSDLTEAGEAFRNGRYYVSATEPGKMTANPSGPVIYLGMFTEKAALTGYGDYAILNPQYRETGHIHRTYRMGTQPAGRQSLSVIDPSGVHSVIGFTPDGTGDEYSHLPRIVCFGNWTGPASVQYTIWLSTYAGTNKDLSAAPTSFADTYLHWTSSDPLEPQGRVRVLSFENPVDVGTYGLRAVLENPYGVAPEEGQDWDVPYAEVEDTVAKRTWTLTVPEDTTGWLARHCRQYFTDHPAVDGKFSFLLNGGPCAYADGRTHDLIRIACAEIHSRSVSAMPDIHSGIGITVDGEDTIQFEFTDDGTVVTANAIPVTMEVTALATWRNLITGILALDDPRIIPVLSGDGEYLLIGVPTNTTVFTAASGGPNTQIVVVSSGAGAVTGTADLLIYDQDNVSLIPASPWYAEAVTLWSPIPLANGLQVQPTAYDVDGASCLDEGGSTAIAVGDYWEAEVSDPAPGASFIYAMGMHQALNTCYPPIPVKAASLELNGVALDSAEFFPESPTYQIALDSVYWYPSLYGTVPWPLDWESPEAPGTDYLGKKLLLHFSKNNTGNTGYVTSLRPAANSPIRVTQCGTNDNANVGDLEIDLDLAMTAQDSNLAGYQVVKSAAGNKLKRGPVVEKIIPGAGISITQAGGAPYGQGAVTISLSSANAVYTGDFEEIALENAKQEMIGMFPYIRLLGRATGGTNTPTGFTAKFRVPHTLPNVPYRVVVYATVFGEDGVAQVSEIVLPKSALSFTYAILPDVYPMGGDTDDPVNNLMSSLVERDAVMTAEVAFGSPTTPSMAYNAYDPMLVHNYDSEGADKPGQRLQALGNPFPNPDDIAGSPSNIGVKPGSLVAVRFGRMDLPGVNALSKPEYTGAIGFINLRWMLIGVN